MQVQKRNGKIVDFDVEKIKRAILKAYNEVYDLDNNESMTKNLKTMKRHEAEKAGIMVMKSLVMPKMYKDVFNIEEIQDMVEKILMDTDKDVAKAYITYRYKHAMMRDKYSEFMNNVKEKIMATNIVNQNANVDEMSFGGRKGEAANTLLKQFALDYCMSDMSKNNHLNNEIYIHDLDSYAIGMHNCLSIPFDDLLANGFNTRQVDIRPANSVNTAFQLLAVVFQIQSLQQFGGVSATHLDWTMIPFVRKSFSKHMKDGLRYVERCTDEEYINSIPKELKFDDEEINIPIHKNAYKYAMDMTIKETQQAVEGMFHNLNSLQSRSGNQLKMMAG